MKENPAKLISNLYRRNQMFWGQALKDYNISSAEYPILIVLSNEKDGITQEEIATRLSVDKSGITRSIKSLEEKNLVERKKDHDDLRCNRVFLTSKGYDVCDPIQEGLERWNTITSANIKEEDIEQVARVLSQMLHNIEEYLG